MKHMSRSKRSPYPSSHEHGSVDQIPNYKSPLGDFSPIGLWTAMFSTGHVQQQGHRKWPLLNLGGFFSGPGGETDDRLQPTWEVCPNA